MKTKLHLLTKTLLVAAGLCVGVSAWSGTKTYDFQKYCKDHSFAYQTTTSLTTTTVSGGKYTHSDGSTWKNLDTWVVQDLSDFSFNGRLAVNNGSKQLFRSGNSSNADSGKGIQNIDKARPIAIVGLVAGDKFTVNCSENALTFISTNVTGKTTADVLESGTEYTVETDGNVGFVFASYGYIYWRTRIFPWHTPDRLMATISMG